MKKVISFLLVACCAIGQAKSEGLQTVSPSEIWAAGNKNFLSITDDFRSLDVTVPLPALPYMPPISFHGKSFEAVGAGRRPWQEGGSRTIRAQLPFGLTLEAGNRFDSLNQSEDKFVGLTFRYSGLSAHNQLVAAYKTGPKPDPIPTNSDAKTSRSDDESGSGLWRIGGAIALLAIMSGGSGGGGAYEAPVLEPAVSSPQVQDQENPYFVSGSVGDWHMVWNDEFDSSVLDTSKWNTTDSYNRDQCFGGGNNEQQCYSGDAQNVDIVNGKLVLTARSASGLAQGRTFTSGRVQSRGKGDFTYGKIEASIKLPNGQGSWPAFWMLPTPSDGSSGGVYGTWAASGEIDIMEAVNLGDTAPGCPAPCNDIHGTLHFGGQWPENAQTPSGSSTLLDVDAFHTYAIEWYPDEIRWFLDGQQYHSRRQTEWYSQGAPNDPNAPFDRDFHLILNLAIGGNWPGATDGQGFPRQMEVDFVRVSQCGGDNPSACKN